jgi:hypothetical protein
MAGEGRTHSNPERPSSEGSWPATILIALPVMKPLTAGAGMNSTTQPILSMPTAKVMKPQMNPRVVAICGLDHRFGWVRVTWLMISPTVRDITATGWGRSAVRWWERKDDAHPDCDVFGGGEELWEILVGEAQRGEGRTQ